MIKRKKIFLLEVLIIILALFIPHWGMVSFAKKLVDTSPPTPPSNLVALSVTQTAVSLSWSPSYDNKGISSYLIFKNSIYVYSVSSTTYTLTGLSASTNYTITVKARDYSGNISTASNILNVTTSSQIQASKISVGYYAGWSAYSGYTPLNIPAASLTHINYAFANIGSDLKIVLGDPSIDTTNFTKLNELKKAYPHIKTLISIGGWEWSGKFSDVALTDSSRNTFADSVIAFIKQYGFDGVDLDWEYPVSGGLSTNIKRPEDRTNLTLLLKAIRLKLNTQSITDNKKYLLTIAGGAGNNYTLNTELNLIHSYLDYANIMTYDIHGPWDSNTDFNAPLYNPTEASPQYKWSVDSAVKAWMSKGFPSSKIVIGLPLYGYIYNGITNSTNGLYKTFISGSSITYDKIVSSYLTNASYIKYYHAVAKVPWLFNGSSFISYDNTQSITEKARYIMQNSLAGAALWELSQNKDGTIASVIYNNLK